MTTLRKSRYGWIPDKPDQRDLAYQAIRPMKLAPEPLPEIVDLRKICMPVVDQGNLGSCTANAIAAAYEALRIQRGDKDVEYFSRLFIYYNERVIEGTVQVDSGAYIRDGIKSIAAQGVCLEKTWPYVIPNFRNDPSEDAFDEAMDYQALVYARVRPKSFEVCQALADGNPVVFGFTVYESFESQETAQSGIVPLPKRNETVLGGHAVLAVGYDRMKQHFLVRNSWGTSWGLKGYFYMPFAYIEDLASDFWVIKKAE